MGRADVDTSTARPATASTFAVITFTGHHVHHSLPAAILAPSNAYQLYSPVDRHRPIGCDISDSRTDHQPGTTTYKAFQSSCAPRVLQPARCGGPSTGRASRFRSAGQ